MAFNNLKDSKTLPQNLQTIDGHHLDVRNLFTYYTNIQDSKKFLTIKSNLFLCTNIVDYNVIFDQIWLNVVNLQINWKTNWFSICPNGGQVFELFLRDGQPEQLKIKNSNTEN